MKTSRVVFWILSVTVVGMIIMGFAWLGHDAEFDLDAELRESQRLHDQRMLNMERDFERKLQRIRGGN